MHQHGSEAEDGVHHAPIDGPPSTLIISLDEPPSSETGRTKHALSNAVHMEFPPEPPDITREDNLDWELPSKTWFWTWTSSINSDWLFPSHVLSDVLAFSD